MHITSNKDGIIDLYYIREGDGKKWTFRCKANAGRIIWASETGRWRDNPADEIIKYKLAGIPSK